MTLIKNACVGTLSLRLRIVLRILKQGRTAGARLAVPISCYSLHLRLISGCAQLDEVSPLPHQRHQSFDLCELAQVSTDLDLDLGFILGLQNSRPLFSCAAFQITPTPCHDLLIRLDFYFGIHRPRWPSWIMKPTHRLSSFPHVFQAVRLSFLYPSSLAHNPFLVKALVFFPFSSRPIFAFVSPQLPSMRRNLSTTVGGMNRRYKPSKMRRGTKRSGEAGLMVGEKELRGRPTAKDTT